MLGPMLACSWPGAWPRSHWSVGWIGWPVRRHRMGVPWAAAVVMAVAHWVRSFCQARVPRLMFMVLMVVGGLVVGKPPRLRGGAAALMNGELVWCGGG